MLDGDQAFSLLAEEVMANVYGGDILRFNVVDGPQPDLQIADFQSPGFEGLNRGVAETFTVADDLTYADFILSNKPRSYFGNPVTAESVKWSWDRRIEMQGVGGFFANVMGIDGPDAVEVISEKHVRFNFAQPSALALKVDAAAFYGGLFDYEEIKKHLSGDPWAKDWLASNTAGFGPYHVESYRKGQELTFVRNPNWFGGKVAFDKVLWRVGSSSSSRVALLSSGDVGIAMNLSPQELDYLKDDDRVDILSYEANKVKHIKLNNTVAPLNDPLVRKALAYAVPQRQIVEDVYFGLATPLKTPVPTVIPGSTDEFWEYDQNIARAKELLAQAGHADGFDLDVIYDVSVPEDELIGTIVRTAFAEIGVRIKLQGVPAAVYADRSNSNSGQAFIGLNYPFVPDAGYHMVLYWQTGQALNTVGYSNPQYDKLVAQLLTVLDEDERNRLASEAQRIWLDDMPWLLLANPGFHVAHRPDLTGFVWHGDNQVRYSGLTSTS